ANAICASVHFDFFMTNLLPGWAQICQKSLLLNATVLREEVTTANSRRPGCLVITARGTGRHGSMWKSPAGQYSPSGLAGSVKAASPPPADSAVAQTPDFVVGWDRRAALADAPRRTPGTWRRSGAVPSGRR
ncbi:hypothetical protein, partial [Chitiniphilus shinanonensis]|uniref:hypothetical protein n=1 Tax=Chitiniphilus shinanonensis TaxID=553088 RepID=UPI001B7F9FB7